MTGEGAARLARTQGIFYLVSGLWPVVHLRSFEAVTGPKVDGWLVKTVGLLLGGIGAIQVQAARSGRVTPEIRNLGAATAGSLAAVDLYYALKGRISKIYLFDAIAEIGLAAAWLRAGRDIESA